MLLRVHLSGWSTQPNIHELSSRIKAVEGVLQVKQVVLPKCSHAYAHVEFEADNNTTPEIVLERLQRTYRGTKWKGGTLKIEKAKPTHWERLVAMRQAAAITEEQPHEKQQSYSDDAPLRIRKKRGRRGVVIVYPTKMKRMKFSEDHTTLASMILDPSYCCTSGDAGPNNTTNTADDDNHNTCSNLARFVTDRLSRNVPNNTTTTTITKTVAPSSLLGKFNKRQR